MAVAALTRTRPARQAPGGWPAFLLDAALAITCYLLAYRLRFPGPAISTFLPAALRSLPLVVGCQLAGLALSGLYGRRPRWMSRVVVGITAGSAAGAALTAGVFGLDGVSRVAFAVDLVLLALGALAWRGGRVIWLGIRPAPVDGGTEMIERGEESHSLSETVSDLYRYRELLRSLVSKDLKLKYRGSVFGFMWSLVNPLVMILVYTVAFTYILRIRTEGYVFFLLLGILAWTFFTNSATMSTGAIVDNGGLLNSVFFPRAILPVATVLFNFAQYLLTTLVFLPAMLILFGVTPSATMLVFPVFLALQVLMTIGVALILSAGTAFFRDIRHLLEIALAMLFWATPIVYEWKLIPEALRLPILLSPLSPFVLAYQKMFYYREWPEFSLWLVAATYAVGAFAVGAALFLALEDQFAEQV